MTAFPAFSSRATRTAVPGAKRSSATSSGTPRPSSCRSSSTPCAVAPTSSRRLRPRPWSTHSSRPIRSSLRPAPFQIPNVPAFAADLAADVPQMHSTGYRRPSDVPGGTVAVVGGGNTGFQIARELSATHSVHLAIGSRQTPLPQRLLGRDLFWWLTKTGLINKTIDSRIGRRARDRDTLIGSSTRDAKRHGVDLEPRVVGASDAR